MPIHRTHRQHGDACRMANALDLVGDQWTLVLAREMIMGPKRFNELHASVRGISTAVLTSRLKTLEEQGIVTRVRPPEIAPTAAYALTAWGHQLEAVIQSLGRWYSARAEPATEGGMTPDALVVALRTMSPPDGVTIPVVELRLRDERRADSPIRSCTVASTGRGLSIEPGTTQHPDATIRADSTALSSAVFGGAQLEQLERARLVEIVGDRQAAMRLIRVFAAGGSGALTEDVD